MSTRTVVRWALLLLALASWAWVLLLALTLGDAAGVDTWFVFSTAASVTLTLCYALLVVLPAAATMFALGVQKGITLAMASPDCTTCPLRQQAHGRHLTTV